MPDFTADIEIDVEEFWENCSKYEQEEMIDMLEEEGWVRRIIPNGKNPGNYKQPSLMDQEWETMVRNLYDLRQRVTLEEEEIIKKIVSRYV